MEKFLKLDFFLIESKFEYRMYFQNSKSNTQKFELELKKTNYTCSTWHRITMKNTSLISSLRFFLLVLLLVKAFYSSTRKKSCRWKLDEPLLYRSIFQYTNRSNSSVCILFLNLQRNKYCKIHALKFCSECTFLFIF